MYYDGFDMMPKWDGNDVSERTQESLHIVGVYDNIIDATKKVEKLASSPVPKDEIVIIDPSDFRHDSLAGISAEMDDSSEGALAGIKVGAIMGVVLGFLSRAILPTQIIGNPVPEMVVSIFLGGIFGSLVGLAIGAVVSSLVSRHHSQKYDEALAEGKYLMAVKHREWERPVRRWLAN